MLVENIIFGSSIGFVQFDFHIPKKLREEYINVPTFLKKTNVCREDIGPLRQKNAERGGLISQQRRMSISSFELKEENVITLLYLF